jgi:hypothetical protein
MTLDGIHSAQASIAVVTNAPSSAILRAFPGSHRGLPLGLAVLGTFLGCLMIPGEIGISRNARAVFLVCLVIFTLGGLSCGGGSGSVTPNGTYNLTVTGTFSTGSAKLTHSTNLTLVVQ